jgi:hypothetical protein
MRRVAPSLLLLLTLGVIAAPATAAGGARVVGNCLRSQVRPRSIVLACADANAQLTHLHWSSFGGASASASGDEYVNDCIPYCAAGHFHSYPVTLVFSEPRECSDGHRDYRLATLRYTSSRRPPHTRGAPVSVALYCPLHR